jgi:hypothetical protein
MKVFLSIILQGYGKMDIVNLQVTCMYGALVHMLYMNYFPYCSF